MYMRVDSFQFNHQIHGYLQMDMRTGSRCDGCSLRQHRTTGAYGRGQRMVLVRAEESTFNEGKRMRKRFDFEYVGNTSAEGSATVPDNEEPCGFSPSDSEKWNEGMKEYEEMKELLLSRTWKFGALFSVYLILTVNGEVAVLELMGSAVGYAYLLLLMKYVDDITEDTDVPMMEIEKLDSGIPKTLAKVGTGYQYSLNSRLLLPVAMAMATVAWNELTPVEQHISLIGQGCLLGGFLGYKVSLLLKIYDDLKPKVLSAEELMRAQRPVLEDLEDVPLDFRKKRKEE